MSAPHDQDNPMQHPEEQPVAEVDDEPKFGRLLLVLGLAVAVIGLITWISVELAT
jgi:hypothetical protein